MSIRLKFLIATLAVGAAVALPSTALAAQQSPASPVSTAAASVDAPTGPHHFKNIGTNYCILVRGIHGHYALDGPCNASPAKNREWFLSLRVVGNNHLGWYHIQNETTHAGCLTTGGPNGDVIQKPCIRGNTSQQWREKAVTVSGGHQWVNRADNMCLDAVNNHEYNVVEATGCNSGSLTQLWNFQAVPR